MTTVMIGTVVVVMVMVVAFAAATGHDHNRGHGNGHGTVYGFWPWLWPRAVTTTMAAVLAYLDRIRLVVQVHLRSHISFSSAEFRPTNQPTDRRSTAHSFCGPVQNLFRPVQVAQPDSTIYVQGSPLGFSEKIRAMCLEARLNLRGTVWDECLGTPPVLFSQIQFSEASSWLSPRIEGV